ncbi:amino acid adenylation domain-containing protein [Aurantibacter crassamenti]|uniref:non-ribosomal peptide synthetase n=1 Tax=Aurantibacter crassamenti TaxID=1837375 RepID=UPI0019394919|nr:non-ribosomal peptide synthetase [Aurantibacter crassamenti]MBM1105824.1 amino acid adenylation domain-containing protein [Aurantibacter crassamenti]
MKQLTTIPKKTKFDPFEGPEIVRVIHTTQSQEEIWADCQLGGPDANRAYNLSISLYLKGELNYKAIEQAIETLVQRHESLRAVFSTDGRYMSIFKNIETKLDYLDAAHLQGDEKKETINTHLREEAYHIFDLVKGPLVKAGLIKINDGDYQLVLTAHHIICDGWSLGIIIQELGALYSANVNGDTSKIPVAESFSAFADERRALIESIDYSKIENYWLQQYKDSIPQLDIPTDFKRPTQRTYRSNRLDFQLDPELLNALKKTGWQAGCSFVSTLMAAFEVFLYQLTGQDKIVLGLPAAGQSAADMNQLIGDCVNLLPIQSQLYPNSSFNSYLKERKTYLLDAYEHQQLSFGYLLQKLAIARDPSRIPLAPVIFNVDLGMSNGVAFAGLDFELKSNHRAFTTFEIFLNASGTQDNLVLEWSYNKALFKQETIEKMMHSFEEVMRRLTAEPTELLTNITDADNTTAYIDLNATKVTYTDLALPELLSNQALVTPLKCALKFKDTEISYKDLQKQTNQLANYFKAKGVEPGDFIGVSISRSSEMVITILAILQCGAAYLPLDPAYPKSRLEFMLNDSEAKFLITTKAISDTLDAQTEILFIEEIQQGLSKYTNEPLSVDISSNDVAYLLYTSGSTGKPKGVSITHMNLVNFLESMAIEPGISENDILLSITTISFDIAGLELFLPLLKGATLVMTEDIIAKDSRLLLELLEKEKSTILQATPTTWQMLLDSGWEHPLPLKALCGGEPLPTKLAKQLLNLCDELWNMYGPTETTIWSTIKKIEVDDPIITIGRPIANTQVYLLNENGKLVAPGRIGEICIGGDGVAQGYWKRPDLTSEKFITNPINLDDKLPIYRTGDLGQLLDSGEIQCLGRIDQQVKIRGHRIELGEIEQALSDLSEIQSAVVLAHNNQLIAYVVPLTSHASFSEQILEWRKALGVSLPATLIPQEFKILTTLPTTPNGKLDRKKLLDSSIAEKGNQNNNTVARTKVEKLVAEIWQKCLNIPEVDIFSNFFEMGGHSIIAVKVMILIEKQTGVRLPLSTLFEHSTVEKLAALLEDNIDVSSNDNLVPIKPNGSKKPLYIIHGAGLNVLIFNSLAHHLDDNQPVYGIEGNDLFSEDGPLPTIEEVAAKYIQYIINADPVGPYSLAGYSLGGYIAYEMARQLKKLGKKVTMLTLFDTYAAPHYYYSSPFRKQMAVLGYHFERLSILFKEMISSWGNFRYHINRKIEGLKARNSDQAETEQALLEGQGHFKEDPRVEKILKKYQLIPDDIEIDLLRVENKTFHLHDPIHLGWNKIALKGVKVYDVPGDHLDMFIAPNDAIAGRVLQKVIDIRNSQ